MYCFGDSFSRFYIILDNLNCDFVSCAISLFFSQLVEKKIEF